MVCVEFHSALQPKLNPIDDDIMDAVHQAIAIAEKDFRGLVVHHQGEQFCAGANLLMILEGAMSQQWKAIDAMVRKFQGMTMGLRRARVPVVTAPFGFTFGGGAEITMAGDRVCALAETYMGLIEVGVGLVPAGGGHVFMLERVLDGMDEPILSNMPFLRKAFEAIAMAKVGTSAEEARELKYLRPFDHVEMNRDQQLWTAKRMAIAMAEEGYRSPLPRTFNLPGRDGLATIQTLLHNMKITHWISSHDEKIATHVGNILCRRRHHDQQPRHRAGDPRPRTRGVPLPARRAQDAGTDPVHADQQQTAEELMRRQALAPDVSRIRPRSGGRRERPGAPCPGLAPHRPDAPGAPSPTLIPQASNRSWR